MNKHNKFKADELNIVGCIFPGSSKIYHYKTLDKSIEANDLVVVHAPDGLKIIEVLTVAPMTINYKFSLKWIVTKVDIEAYETLVEEEKVFNSPTTRARI